MAARCSFVLGILLVLGVSRGAQAQDAGAARAEIAALEQQLAAATVVLSTGGCAVACPALGSMERAAERICALEPGPRCDDARARVRDAERRVRAACPECHVGSVEAPPPVQSSKDGEHAAPPSRTVETSPQALVVQPAPGRGGCAGCVVGGGEPGSGAALLAGLALVLARLRRRTRR